MLQLNWLWRDPLQLSVSSVSWVTFLHWLLKPSDTTDWFQAQDPEQLKRAKVEMS
jgi:hypothetical protein